jgi:cytochrome d ubiquinol oxidase subunit I
MAKYQPMKFAAMENLHEGSTKAPLVVIGAMTENKSEGLKKEDFTFKLEIPNFLSTMAFFDANAFVPGIKDIVYGNPEHNIESVDTKIQKGRLAMQALKDYNIAKKAGDTNKMNESALVLNTNYSNLGYGHLSSPSDIVPPVKLTFYSFRTMVALGFWFVILFGLALLYLVRKKIESKTWYLKAAIISIPLAYLASQLGWIVTEVGRQPWIIQDLMSVQTAVSHLNTGSVITTFIIFAIIFTILLIAEIKIMLKQIKLGFNNGGNE